MDLFDVYDVQFAESTLSLSLAQQTSMDGAWAEAVRESPDLFDGPVVLCTELFLEGAGRLAVKWARGRYRYRVLRQLPDGPALSSVFVCVLQPTQDGRVVIGRMSDRTSNPGQLQLPGGVMEPPLAGQPLTVDDLRRHAGVELLEEVGIRPAVEKLDLWLAVRIPDGNVGSFFTAPPLPAELVIECYTALVDAERAAGNAPEFDALTLIRDVAELAAFHGAPAQYLRPLLERFFEADFNR